MMILRFGKLISILGCLVLSACVSSDGPEVAYGPQEASAADIAALTKAIRALGPKIDPEEAARAARIAYEHSARLAVEYEIEDGPIIHNSKVNLGLKPRGLCWHWAEDMENRLAEENFRTIELHRAIANYDKNFRLEHSTVIVSQRGHDMFAGMVLDPWRYGGRLFWATTTEDTRYNWTPRSEVFAWKRTYEKRRHAPG